MLAANTVVLEGAEIPDRCVVAGVPGVIKKRLEGSAEKWIEGGGSHYVDLSREYRALGIGLPRDTHPVLINSLLESDDSA